MGKISIPRRLELDGKNMYIKHNVCLRVIDPLSNKIVQQHTGHNAATNGLLTGIGHYLTGDGILNQGWSLLSNYLPRYISLGTMGLLSQEEDEYGYPADIGVIEGEDEQTNFINYMAQCPGYGADGYDPNENNGRELLGLGPMFSERESDSVINCELVTEDYRRDLISYREVVPETEAELPKTIDVVFSAMIPTGKLTKFKEEDKDYIFITETGLWSRPDWIDSGDNGLLAGYRITPPNEDNFDMTIASNRQLLKQNILRVGPGQVVQVIWKIQLGALEQLAADYDLYQQWTASPIYWEKWDE